MILQERSERLKDVLPQIKSIQREIGERPIIKFFEGRDGIVSAYEEFYSSVEDGKERQGYLIYNRDILNQTFSPEEQEKFYQIRASKKVSITSIYNNKDGDYPFVTKGIRTRIDSEKYPIYTDVIIIDDKVIFSTLGDYVSSFIIKSKDVAITIASLVQYINDQNKKG